MRNIDAEFNPSDIAIDPQGLYPALPRTTQIKECDFLMDQVMLVDYLIPDVASISFDYKCDVLHEFADVSTKKHSQIIIAYSAEDLSYLKCDGTPLGHYLGKYLDGTDVNNHTGNMYSVEQDFVNLLENQTYICPNCGCATFTDNHFNNHSLQANEIIGSIWFASSFMQSHSLARESNKSSTVTEISISCFPNPTSTNSKISLQNSKIKEVEIIDLNGQQIWFKNVNESELIIDNSYFDSGVYQIKLIDSDNNYHQLKYVIIK